MAPPYGSHFTKATVSDLGPSLPHYAVQHLRGCAALCMSCSLAPEDTPGQTACQCPIVCFCLQIALRACSADRRSVARMPLPVGARPAGGVVASAGDPGK